MEDTSSSINQLFQYALACVMDEMSCLKQKVSKECRRDEV
jgi:hypothetical protein